MKAPKLLSKILNWLSPPKLIELSEAEKILIKFTKMHYKEIYPTRYGWVEGLKPIHSEIYGWDADEHYRDFLRCMFQKLFDTYMKIRQDGSGHDWDIKKIFNAAFEQSPVRMDDLPIERAICELCGLLQSSVVVENGVQRFDLTLNEESK